MHEKEENQIRIFYTKSLIRKLCVKNPIKKGNVAHRTQERSHTEHRKRRTQNTGNVAHRTQETHTLDCTIKVDLQ